VRVETRAAGMPLFQDKGDVLVFPINFRSNQGLKPRKSPSFIAAGLSEIINSSLILVEEILASPRLDR